MTNSLPLETLHTPRGHEVFKFANTGESDQDIVQVLTALVPGGVLFGRPIIFITEVSGKGFPPAVREKIKEYSKGISQNTAPLAVVCTNVLVRFAVKALCILAPHSGPLKVLESETAALAWMDEVIVPVAKRA